MEGARGGLEEGKRGTGEGEDMTRSEWCEMEGPETRRTARGGRVERTGGVVRGTGLMRASRGDGHEEDASLEGGGGRDRAVHRGLQATVMNGRCRHT